MSSRELIVRYLAERARLRAFVPLAGALAIAGWLVGPSAARPGWRLAAAMAESLLLILAFRIWDDLEDRDRDAHEHPDRVLVKASRTGPIAGVAAVLGAVGVAALATSPARAARLITLAVAGVILGAWYRRRGARSALLGGHVLLVKYPLIALAVAPVPPSFAAPADVWRAGAILGAIYLALCIHEHLDDPVLRASRASRGVALMETVLLIPLVAAAASLLGGVRP